MASWRENASQQAQDDLDGLFGSALDFAQQQLDKNGEFYPFAFTVNRDGTQQIEMADTGAEYPDSAELLTMLTAGLSAKRDDLRATALVADVSLPESDRDAVRVTVEHAEGVALTILLPYELQLSDGSVGYGELQASPATAEIWPAS